MAFFRTIFLRESDGIGFNGGSEGDMVIIKFKVPSSKYFNMKFLIQFLIIIAFSFAGELLHFLLPLPIPASIYGIILLFLALETKLIKVKHIRETSSFLIAIMPVMFIPAAVGLIDSYQDIGNAWFQYIVVTVVSTFVVMGASGWITQLVIRKGKEAKK